MTIDEAVKVLRTLRAPATDLERDLALSVVAIHLARSMAVDGDGEFCVDDVAIFALAISESLEAHPEPQHLGNVSRSTLLDSARGGRAD